MDLLLSIVLMVLALGSLSGASMRTLYNLYNNNRTIPKTIPWSFLMLASVEDITQFIKDYAFRDLRDLCRDFYILKRCKIPFNCRPSWRRFFHRDLLGSEVLRVSLGKLPVYLNIGPRRLTSYQWKLLLAYKFLRTDQGLRKIPLMLRYAHRIPMFSDTRNPLVSSDCVDCDNLQPLIWLMFHLENIPVVFQSEDGSYRTIFGFWTSVAGIYEDPLTVIPRTSHTGKVPIDTIYRFYPSFFGVENRNGEVSVRIYPASTREAFPVISPLIRDIFQKRQNNPTYFFYDSFGLTQSINKGPWGYRGPNTLFFPKFTVLTRANPYG